MAQRKAKLRVFLAHSFDETKRPDELLTDVQVANWFAALMKKRPLSFSVVTGAKPSPGPIDEKVTADIADSSCVVGVFTKRHLDANTKHWLPSLFVLCECACAMGFFRNTAKLICGFYEEGIDPRDLALVTVGGLELVPFNRNALEDGRTKFVDYLKALPDLLASGTLKDGQLHFFRPPFVQQRLRKIFTIYRNGNVTVQNLNQMLITDAEKFGREYDQRIPHEIWHRRTPIPPLDTMLSTSVDHRRQKAFLHGILRAVNQREMDVPLQIIPRKHEGKRAFFDAGFVDHEGKPIRFKSQDIVRYQYAWGIPGAYPATDEGLPEPMGGAAVNEGAYCQAEVFASHGLILEVTLDVRFEKGSPVLFSKSPFFQTTPQMGDMPHWSSPVDLPLADNEEDHAMWFQTYRLVEKNFLGKLRVLWRPPSKDE